MLIPHPMIEQARANIRKHPWAAQASSNIVEAAAPWLKMTDDELWSLMFGPTITRSWMVWSNGHCPACQKSVPMYNWEIDALVRPWKTRCPHCRELFPKNDFAAFYRSGLDAHGIFDPRKADRSMLFNTEHPDPGDPLRGFGVDDGEGYVDGGRRWRFIGAYLVYGQWKQAVQGGIRNLADAYVVTGEAIYAHKAAILLDRVADLYPTFDHNTQAWVYETQRSTGYVTTWHDACEETRELALAYDQIREGLQGDEKLVSFLTAKARQFRPANAKTSIGDIRRNIEERILRDAIANAVKIQSNYPRTEIALAIIRLALGTPADTKLADAIIDDMLVKATAIEGVTGEKGLANYSAFVVQSLAVFLGQMERSRPGFLAGLIERHPQLRQTYRFHIDTWCMQQYYPLVGDSSWFAARTNRYAGVVFSKHAGITPSPFTFLWRLYELTGDEAYVQTLYHANGNSVEGLPHDLFASDPAAFQKQVAAVIDRHGPIPRLASVNKQAWHLAILRSGQGEHGRAAWLAYDTGGRHGHANGMNLGLFARGLDLMPDLGYPPVQFGGWGSPRAVWYRMTAAHNTVVVDGADQPNSWNDPTVGRTKLWADGQTFHVVRASDPAIAFEIRNPKPPRQYERTVALVDLPGKDFYLLDIFRVVGGKDHAKFMHSHFGRIATQGLALKPASDYGHGTQMRNFKIDPAPQSGWSVDWTIEDRYNYLPKTEGGLDLHLRYTDLTRDAQAYTCEGWITSGGYDTEVEAWIPRAMTRRTSAMDPLASTFVAVIEPYNRKPAIANIRRLTLQTPAGHPFGDANVAVEIGMQSGARHLFVAADAENPQDTVPSFTKGDKLVQAEWQVRLDGEMCLIRRSSGGPVESIVLCRCRSLRIGDIEIMVKEPADFLEISFAGGRPQVVTGNQGAVDIRFPSSAR